MVNSSEPNRKQIEEEHNNTLYQWFLDLGRAIQKAGTDDNPFGKLHSLVSSQQWYIDATKFVFDPPKAEYKHRYVLVLISNLKTLIVNSEVLIQKKDEIVEKQVAEASIRALEEKYLGFKKSIKAQQNSLQKPREASLIALFNISFGIWMGLFVLMLSMGSNVGFAYKVETTANDLAKAINSTFIPTSNMTLNSTSSNTTNHNAEIIADINWYMASRGFTNLFSLFSSSIVRITTFSILITIIDLFLGLEFKDYLTSTSFKKRRQYLFFTFYISICSGFLAHLVIFVVFVALFNGLVVGAGSMPFQTFVSVVKYAQIVGILGMISVLLFTVFLKILMVCQVRKSEDRFVAKKRKGCCRCCC